MKSIILILTLITFISCQRTVIRSPASIQSERKISIVFDIDYTIVQPATDLNDSDVILIEGEHYKVNNWAREMIESLSRHPNVEISFFSGGKKDRNQKLLREIKMNTGESFLNIAGNVYSYSDLHQVQEEGRFSERLKKDLKILDFDLERTILIDDNSLFTHEGQDKNMLWLGKTYHHYEDFNKTYADIGNKKVLQEFIPENFQQWFLARNKLKFVHELIEDAIRSEKTSTVGFLDFIEANKKTYIPYDEKITSRYRSLFSKQFFNNQFTCSRAVLSFK